MTEYQRLKIFLNKIGISQAELADMFGIDRSTMSKMLNGKLRLQIDLLQKLHYKFFLNLNWLLCGTGKMRYDMNDNELDFIEEQNKNNKYNECLEKYIKVLEELNDLRKKVEFLLEKHSDINFNKNNP